MDPTEAADPSIAGRNDYARDVLLLAREQGQRNLSRGQLAHALRLALLCRTRKDQELVSLILWHQLPMDEVAQRLHLTGARARELYQSLLNREAAVRGRVQKDRRIERADPILRASAAHA